MCFTKTTAGSVEATAYSMDTAFLVNLTSPAREEMICSTCIQLNSKLTPFKLDTGAEVTAISGTTHEHLGKPKLNTPDKILYGPSRQPLQVYVVKGLKTNLLGLPAITALNLAARIDTTAHDEIPNDIRKRFPKVFEDVGNLGEEFTINSSQMLPLMHCSHLAMWHCHFDPKWRTNSNEWSPWESSRKLMSPPFGVRGWLSCQKTTAKSVSALT